MKHTEDQTFLKKWAAVKQSNKERLAHHVEILTGIKINTKAMFDVQIKRLHEYKRQTMNIMGVIHVRRRFRIRLYFEIKGESTILVALLKVEGYDA